MSDHTNTSPRQSKIVDRPRPPFDELSEGRLSESHARSIIAKLTGSDKIVLSQLGHAAQMISFPERDDQMATGWVKIENLAEKFPAFFHRQHGPVRFSPSFNTERYGIPSRCWYALRGMAIGDIPASASNERPSSTVTGANANAGTDESLPETERTPPSQATSADMPPVEGTPASVDIHSSYERINNGLRQMISHAESSLAAQVAELDELRAQSAADIEKDLESLYSALENLKLCLEICSGPTENFALLHHVQEKLENMIVRNEDLLRDLEAEY